ncbi:aminotransferase class I/II-fold pyridoxal phosphate-dependent enzyme [Nitrococcus mobilis]|uniref:aminotransferase class I/II-fold pyridoxal phosphate-dependent enzyme n=1 Tax=Nitrococcus mobilis TaxID=35797 RepID=UPI00032557E6|nr:8-amino-7-oxononanoate synthase [Nitrococcus mobilis]
MDKYAFIERALAERKGSDQFRSLQTLVPDPSDPVIVYRNGRRMLSFCSNDYLGLSRHPKLRERAAAYTRSHGAGATGSRLVCGTFDIHARVEEKLARLYGREAAVLFNSGFQANSTLLAALAGRGALLLADKLSHNSLLQGALLSRATFRRYRHRDLTDLERRLRATVGCYERILIVTESIFSMDGDRSDMDRLVELAGEYNAFLIIDDAHAVGVWGEQGLGLTARQEGIDLVIGTFGKAYGSFGAFVLCAEPIKDYLINFCPGFIYTTALPPPVIGSIEAALELVPGLEQERAYLHRLSERVRSRLGGMGFDTQSSTTQIIPILLGDEGLTLSLSRWLEQHGILAAAIRPPTVEPGRSRIRITLSSGHTPDYIDYFLRILQGWNGAKG